MTTNQGGAGARVTVTVLKADEIPSKYLPVDDVLPFREESWVLTGKRSGPALVARRHVYQSGTYGTVGFDYRWLEQRETERHDIVGFAHTHPPGAGASPSETDRVTMEGWVDCLGRSLLCIITCGRRTRCWLYRKAGDRVELSVRLLGRNRLLIWGG